MAQAYAWTHDGEQPPSWVFSAASLGGGVYALNDGREISLLDRETLTLLLRQLIGGNNDSVGGSPLG